jgi:hypothetical protein
VTFWLTQGALLLTLAVLLQTARIDSFRVFNGMVVADLLGAVLQAALAAGAALPAAAYELHYARYDEEWVVSATWLVPLQRIAGDLAATQWAQALAAQWPPNLPPTARKPAPLVITVPPLGPVP